MLTDVKGNKTFYLRRDIPDTMEVAEIESLSVGSYNSAVQDEEHKALCFTNIPVERKDENSLRDSGISHINGISPIG